MNTTNEAREHWLTMRLTTAERARLAAEARRRGVRVADVVREELGPILAGAVIEAAPAGAGAAMQAR